MRRGPSVGLARHLALPLSVFVVAGSHGYFASLSSVKPSFGGARGSVVAARAVRGQLFTRVIARLPVANQLELRDPTAALPIRPVRELTPVSPPCSRRQTPSPVSRPGV